MIRLHTTPGGQKAENTSGQAVAMRRMLRMMARIIVGPTDLTSFVAQHQMELGLIHPNSNGVRTFQCCP